MGKRNRKAAERRRQKNLEKKKKRRANSGVKRRKGRGRKLSLGYADYPLRGEPVHLEDPHGPAVPSEDWEALKEEEDPIVVGDGGIETIQDALDEVSEDPKIPYSEMTVAQLKKSAAELGLTGYSKMKKAELVAACEEAS